MSEEAETKEVVFSRAKNGKRIGAFFLDVFCLFFLTFLLFASFHPVLNYLPYYEETLKVREELQSESGLYREDGTDLVTYLKSEDSETEYPSARAKKDLLSSRIDAFYQNDTFLSKAEQEKTQQEYEVRKTEALHGQEHLFVRVDNALTENDVNPEWLLSFYEKEANNYAQPIFVGYLPYLRTTRVIWMSSFVEALIALTFSFALFYVVIPLTWGKRGRKSIGMKAMRIGYVTGEGLSPSPGKAVLHAVFVYFVMLLLSFVSFLLPLFVSFGMMMLGKKKQNLDEYLFNWTPVDDKDQEIYLDYADFWAHEKAKKEASIENKDFQIDHPSV